ncbi:hypothetical protein [Peribacillus sp. TH27]|uniref:hypothetical protein n=1 Tax=Peribacillus sp. TH27 TaxID=2798484 RepID=UPI0019118142|nr:hypothetical protein [Peribacillus sp. TH27]MBK5463567.1 hypothetical protein [Peribacillus sp. TH27]
MKKLAILPIVAVLSLSIFSGNKAEAAINNKPGDIIVTKSTAGSGIVGHSGIYIDTTHILHTSGRKNEPYPRIDTESEWHARYAQSKVVRPDSSTIGSKSLQRKLNTILKVKQYLIKLLRIQQILQIYIVVN